MQTLRGTVTGLSRSTHISGNRSSVSTTNVTVFEIAGQPVVLKAMGTIIINNSDEVVVAGEQGKDGVFKAYAYKNVTKQVHGGSSSMALIVTAVFMLTSPLVACGLGYIVPSGGMLFCMLPIFMLFALGGGILLYFALKQRNAWKAVA